MSRRRGARHRSITASKNPGAQPLDGPTARPRKQWPQIVCALVLRTHPKRGSRIHNKRGGKMPAAKLVVIYPVPTDLEQFERRYLEHHVPMAVDRLAGKTKIVRRRCWLELPLPAGVKTEFLDYSPYNPTRTSRTAS